MSNMVKEYSSSDLSRKSADVIAEALRHPVTITQHSKPRLVLMNIVDYKRLIAQNDTRSVHTIESMSDELFEEFQKAATEYGKNDA
ncbi:type II toxin-antitoxin system prevent-host-death family antitoxin [Bartonella choladocola]|uniref:Antitoxin n=1 Tax=Bartonella choladocola TaxID=2750995 RepID=A0A1U9MJ43_9HYPH|nr:type II toxin-antitoxin system prevent-host-death family antitoxin [Bartonella choladocola]AQT47935.1 prevent-host-death family protein [Bartonella choladocola]